METFQQRKVKQLAAGACENNFVCVIHNCVSHQLAVKIKEMLITSQKRKHKTCTSNMLETSKILRPPSKNLPDTFSQHCCKRNENIVEQSSPTTPTSSVASQTDFVHCCCHLFILPTF